MRDEPAFPFGQASELTRQPINGFFAQGLSKQEYAAIELAKAMFSNPALVNNFSRHAEIARESVIAAKELFAALKEDV